MVIARFDSYRRAEHVAASLGREFGRKARKGGAIAVVVRGGPDGSLIVTESRVLSAGDLASGLMPVSLAWMAAFMGPFFVAKGARGGSAPPRAAEGTLDRVGTGLARSSPVLARIGPGACSLQGPTDAPDGRRGRGRQRQRWLGWLDHGVSLRH
jgi:hypothetical protein